MFSDIQNLINSSWNQWRKRKKPINPKRQRKKQLCPKCGKQHFSVKMDYLGNKHIKYKITVYNVDFFKCPRCNFIDKLFYRIEGRGTIGFNSGKTYGGI